MLVIGCRDNVRHWGWAGLGTLKPPPTTNRQPPTTNPCLRRRKVAEWGASSNGSGRAVALNSSSGDTSPSYKELVRSFSALTGGDGEAQLDIQELVRDERTLAEALAVGKTGKISFVEQQSKLLGKADKQYAVRMSE